MRTKTVAAMLITLSGIVTLPMPVPALVQYVPGPEDLPPVPDVGNIANWCLNEQVRMDYWPDILGGFETGPVVDPYRTDYGIFWYAGIDYDEEQQPIYLFWLYGFADEATCGSSTIVDPEFVIAKVEGCLAAIMLNPDPLRDSGLPMACQP